MRLKARTVKLHNRRVTVGKFDDGSFFVRFRKLLDPEKRMSKEWPGLVLVTSFALTREAFGALAQLAAEQIRDETGENA